MVSGTRYTFDDFGFANVNDTGTEGSGMGNSDGGKRINRSFSEHSGE